MSSKKINLHVQAGSLKGLVLEFPIGQFPETGVTQQKLKETILAIAASLYPELKDKMEPNSKIFFADLFAGSGQMGIEAFSQGFRPIIINELDFKKFIWLKGTLMKISKRLESDSDRQYLIFKQKNALKLLAKPERIFSLLENFTSDHGIFFCDPPFILRQGRDDLVYWKKIGQSVESFLINIKKLITSKGNNNSGKTEFQRNRYILFLHLPKSINRTTIIKTDEEFEPFMDRIYGNHRLLVWDMSDE
jgi:16S rRNA G966 N2-methylase RsmD